MGTFTCTTVVTTGMGVRWVTTLGTGGYFDLKKKIKKNKKKTNFLNE
jgi:hypothetical protein